MSAVGDMTCPNCEGTGTSGFDRNQSHTEGRYVEYPCQECGGSGLNPGGLEAAAKGIHDAAISEFANEELPWEYCHELYQKDCRTSARAAVAAFLAYGKEKR